MIYNGLPVLERLSESGGYTVAYGNEYVSVKLAGGPSRRRKDFEGAANIVNVEYTLSGIEFRNFQNFYNGVIAKGVLPFATQLIIDSQEPEYFQCFIVPDSYSLSEQSGDMYKVSFQIEATTIGGGDEIPVEDTQALFNEYGMNYESLFISDEDLLNEIINVNLPTILG